MKEAQAWAWLVCSLRLRLSFPLPNCSRRLVSCVLAVVVGVWSIGANFDWADFEVPSVSHRIAVHVGLFPALSLSPSVSRVSH